jgi:uncharacterized protein (DUF1778 family)
MVKQAQKTSTAATIRFEEQMPIRQETETIVLSPRDSLALIQMLENPPPPNEVLKQAMREYEASGIGMR